MSEFSANKVSSLVSGPVRRIGIQSRSITGTMPDGNRYESSLERDFMLLVRFNPAVDIYTPQPVTFRYQASDGNWCRYTPDGLIEWRSDYGVHDQRPLLVEIKYRESFREQWRAWRDRLRAGRNFAKERGWVFEVYTERDIRIPFLDNARFLLPYLNREIDSEIELSVLDKLSELVETSPRELLGALCQDKWGQAAFIPVIWKLLGARFIGCDLTEPLTMQSTIWSLRG